MSNSATRRRFIKTSVMAIASAPIAMSISSVRAEQPKLSEDDPMALALGYKEDTKAVDASKYPTHAVEQICTGCALYQGDDPEWGGCGAFPGKLVAGQGWCVAYAPKPS